MPDMENDNNRVVSITDYRRPASKSGAGVWLISLWHLGIETRLGTWRGVMTKNVEARYVAKAKAITGGKYVRGALRDYDARGFAYYRGTYLLAFYEGEPREFDDW
jgi:hypothetical protein